MKTILITGASSEIGLSIANRLENNNNLILIKHKKDIDLKFFRTKPLIYTCDFNNQEELLKLTDNLKSKQIDVLINVAAYDQNDSIENIKIEDFEKTLKVNLITPFMLIQNLIQKNNLIIINIGSSDGIDTFNEYNITYATSKAALIHLTKQLKYIYQDMNIYCLCPNYVNTTSVQSMEPHFLQNELKRIKQKELIDVKKISEKVEELIKEKPNEIIIRME